MGTPETSSYSTHRRIGRRKLLIGAAGATTVLFGSYLLRELLTQDASIESQFASQFDVILENTLTSKGYPFEVQAIVSFTSQDHKTQILLTRTADKKIRSIELIDSNRVHSYYLSDPEPLNATLLRFGDSTTAEGTPIEVTNESLQNLFQVIGLGYDQAKADGSIKVLIAEESVSNN